MIKEVIFVYKRKVIFKICNSGNLCCYIINLEKILKVEHAMNLTLKMNKLHNTKIKLTTWISKFRSDSRMYAENKEHHIFQQEIFSSNSMIYRFLDFSRISCFLELQYDIHLRLAYVLWMENHIGILSKKYEQLNFTFLKCEVT